MASTVEKKKRLKYAPDQMQRAIEAVQSGLMSKKAAARNFDVPRTTLLDKLAGRVPAASGIVGRKPVLTQGEEEMLVAYAIFMSEIGCPVSQPEFLKEVKHVLDHDGRKTPFRDNLPGYKWFNLFRKRNPNFTMRKPMSLGQERANVTLEKLQNWFEGLNNFLKEEVPGYESIIKNPSRIFNADESGFPLSVKPDRVMARKGSKNVFQVVTNTKTQITVLAACNAVGDYVPPLILFAGERMRDVGFSGFPDAQYAVTKNGWMETDTFVSYLNVLVDFAKEQKIEFPIILFIDGHSTHIGLDAAEFCKENDVILYCLLANATHILQPLDIGFFSPMKRVWQRTVKDWQIENFGQALGKKQFPALFNTTWQQVATFENAAHGFRKAGLYPLSIDGIDFSKLAKNVDKLPINNETQTNAEANSSMVEENADQPNDQESVQNAPNNDTQANAEANDSIVDAEANDSIVEDIADQPQAQEQETPNKSSTEITASTSTNNDPISSRSDVSPSFSMLRVPTPKEKKKVNRLNERLPKAISGSKAIQMLKDKQEKKKAEEMAKSKRKEERLVKRQKKAEEQEKKRIEREQKKRIKELEKERALKRGNKKQRMHDSSDTEDDYKSSDCVDDDTDDFVDEDCPGCNRCDQDPSRWVECIPCGTKWHFMCANHPEYEMLDVDERRKMDFICPMCI